MIKSHFCKIKLFLFIDFTRLVDFILLKENKQNLNDTVRNDFKHLRYTTVCFYQVCMC